MTEARHDEKRGSWAIHGGMIDWLIELQRTNPHVLKALLVGTLVSTACGVTGCWIILRRMAFLADALAHAMLAGVVGGFLVIKLLFGSQAYAPAMLVGSVFAALFTVVVVGWVSRVSRIKEDTVIGITYTGVFALGGVLLSFFSRHVHIDVVHFLTGQLLAVRMADLWAMAVVTVFVLSVYILFFRSLQLVAFDRVLAASIGIPVLAFDYLLTACTSFVVVSGVNVVGVILVVGLLIIPAATAYLLCDRLPRMLAWSAFFGWTSFIVGYLWAEAVNVAPGSAVVVTGAVQFFLVLLVAPRYGVLADWLRRRRMIPQTFVEDVLRSVLKSGRSSLSLGELAEYVGTTPERLTRVVQRLVREHLLERHDDQVQLTADGRQYARRLQRAHRLWETYLASVGTPRQELHDRADAMEHVHDEQAVDYLDDRMGHPLHDPHGSEIPEDFVHLVPGADVPLAMLRDGHRAVIVRVDDRDLAEQLRVGDRVTVRARTEEGKQWNVELEDGRRLGLTHAQTDQIYVRLLEGHGREDGS